MKAVQKLIESKMYISSMKNIPNGKKDVILKWLDVAIHLLEDGVVKKRINTPMQSAETGNVSQMQKLEY